MGSFVVALVLSAAVSTGTTAPDFSRPSIDGQTLHLEELVKQGDVILAFFPRAFTGGCTKELTAYTGMIAEVQKRGGRLVAVSTDSAETLKKFKASLKAPFDFISDADQTLVKLFDVKMPVLSLSRRYTFVIGPDRKVLHVEEGNDAIDPKGSITACSLHAHDAASKGTPAGK